MNKIEVWAFTLLVVFNLAEQEKDPEVAFPLLLTFSDRTDHVLGEFSWHGRRGGDVFGIGDRLLNWSEIQLPVTMAARDQNGKEGTIEITQDMVDACIAGVKKAIQ